MSVINQEEEGQDTDNNSCDTKDNVSPNCKTS